MNSMNKVFAAVSSVLVLFSIFALNSNDRLKPVEGGGITYPITFTSEDPAIISSETFGNGTKTIKGVVFNYFSALDTNGYHTQLDAYGYIENATQQITSITRVTAVFTGALTLSTGYKANNYDNNYTLTSGVGQAIADAPYFMQIYANSVALISSIEIRYSCTPPTPQPSYTLSGDSSYYILNGYSRIAVDITIPSSYNGLPVKEIADSAFASNQDLKSVVIPSSVTTIGANAFDSCDGLVSVTVPDSVTSIGNSAFAYCNSLTSFHIPSGLTAIADYLFLYDTSLASLTIPSTVTTIGDEAFLYCSSLDTITFDDETAITSVGYHSFWNSSWLELQRAINPLVSIHHILIDGFTATGAVVIPEGITSINSNAFFNTDTSAGSALTSVSFPASLTTIEQSAFNTCSDLASITFSTGLLTIDQNAFYNSGLVSLHLPDSVTSIGVSAFQYNAHLSTVSLSSGLTTLSTYVFGDCPNLTSVTMESGLLSIGQGAFYRCSSLDNVVIPSGVTFLGSMAFGYCTILDSVSIPSSVTTLEEQVFTGAKWLTDQRALGNHVVTVNGIVIDGASATGAVSIASGATTILSSSFKYNTNITSMILPEGITSIGEHSFENATALTSIVIPSSVTSIGYAAFFNNSALATVYYGGANLAAWNTITDGTENDYLYNATRYYYSATPAAGYWHFVENVPALWVD